VKQAGVGLAYQSSGTSAGSDGQGSYSLSTSGTLDYQLSKTVYTPTGSEYSPQFFAPPFLFAKLCPTIQCPGR
jgi:hypothetical protein